MPVKHRRRRARGYMLVEALVAGAVIGALLVTMTAQTSQADLAALAAIRKVQAAYALQDGLHRVFSAPFASVATGSTTDYPPGCHRRDVVISTNALTASDCAGCLVGTVNVQFKDAGGKIQTVSRNVQRAPL